MPEFVEAVGAVDFNRSRGNLGKAAGVDVLEPVIEGERGSVLGEDVTEALQVMRFAVEGRGASIAS